MTNNMEQQERIRLLLSMQEHPGCHTDEQITRMLADDPELAELMEQLAMTKRAFAKQEADKERLAMDDLWEQFASEHEEELDILGTRERTGSGNRPTLGTRPGKVLCMAKRHCRAAAVFIGILLTAGFAFAAIHIVRHYAGADTPSPNQEIPVPNPPQQDTPATAIPTDTAMTDTATMAMTATPEPVVFDNVRLDEILPQIGAYYHADVMFENEATRQLRFHFVWRQEDGLEHAIEKLNRFESLSIRLEDSKIIVE